MNFLEKIYTAVTKSLQNAEDLFVDASVLEQVNRLPRAYTMYHFSFEEAGRCFILLRIVVDHAFNKIEFRDIKPSLLKSRGYEDHLKKLKKSTSEFKKHADYMVSLGTDKKLMEKLEGFYKQLDEIKMNANKNGSIYICFSDNEFKTPSESINEDDLHEMKFLAEMNIRFAKQIVSVFDKAGSLKALLAELRTVVE